MMKEVLTSIKVITAMVFTMIASSSVTGTSSLSFKMSGKYVVSLQSPTKFREWLKGENRLSASNAQKDHRQRKWMAT